MRKDKTFKKVFSNQYQLLASVHPHHMSAKFKLRFNKEVNKIHSCMSWFPAVSVNKSDFLCRVGYRPKCVCLVSTLIIFAMYHPPAGCWLGVKWLLCLHFLEVIATFISHRRLSTHMHWNDLNDCLSSVPSTPSWAFFEWSRTDLSLHKQANTMTSVMWRHKTLCWKSLTIIR